MLLLGLWWRPVDCPYIPFGSEGMLHKSLLVFPFEVLSSCFSTPQ